MIRICWAFVLLFLSSQLSAQNFGGFSPRTKWKQINTDTARVIFEAQNTQQASRVATIIHQLALQQPASLGNKLKKVNIVLHKNTTLANAYVGLGPFRSEYYLVPSTNVFELGSLPWNEYLAVHEYRHVQQYNNFNRGLSRGFQILFGEGGRALANSLALPNWFFEGDAVHAETSLTPQGRGRLPLFLSGYNSLWQADKNYRLSKLLNGSLKDYVPNHYQLGYLAVNYGYDKYGTEFWRKVTNDAAAFKGLVYPFRKAVREHSGKPYRQFMKEALAENKQRITTEEADVRKRKGVVTNFYFPQYIGNDSIVYLKDSYRKLPAFYIKDAKGEHRIKLKSISSDDWLSYRNGVVAYTAYATNARWSLTDYSNIVLLDVPTGRETVITHKGKYFTPDVSPSGSHIVAVSINEATETELHVVSKGGSVTKVVKSNGRYFIHPRFVDEDNIVIGIRKEDGSVSINKMNLVTEGLEPLTPSSFSAIGYPSISGDKVYFTASYNGNDELYAVGLNDKKIFQLTRTQTGNYYATASADSLYWSHFTSVGLRLQEKSNKSLLWQEINETSIKQPVIQQPVAQPGANILATPTRTFAIKNYNKSTGLFNFHSLQPSYSDPELVLSLYGNNILNTLSSEIFYRYNQNEQSHGAGVNFDYAAWFPVLTVGAEYTFNRNISFRTSPTTIRSGILNGYELKGGYYIPLNFSAGKMYKFLTFGSSYVFNQQSPVGDTKNYLRSFNSTYLYHFLNWSQRLPKAIQHIYPKFGYALNSAYRHRVDRAGYQALVNPVLYLPSIKNHSLVLSGSFQQVDTSNTLFSNRFTNSRGYPETYYSKMWRASANYHFPLAYPDWGFGGIVYFLRVRSNLFYDYTKGYFKNRLTTVDLRSTGAELFFDTKWWNQLPVSFGIRYSYLIDGDRLGLNKHQWELIIPTDLF